MDHVSRYSLSREALEKHRKRRQKRDDETNRLKHVERQEELAKKKVKRELPPLPHESMRVWSSEDEME